MRPTEVDIATAARELQNQSAADVLRWGSAAYVLFMVVNPVIWPYLFTPALLGLVFTLAARGRTVQQN